jgi:hypothetical protein
MKSAELDRLERELGLMSDEGDAIVQSPESEVIASVRPSERRVGGCVSSLWLCGIFGGCVPSLYSCWLTDWMILQGGRYAGQPSRPMFPRLTCPLSGIFLTAAFFGIYSSALTHMDGANIRKWIDKVLSGEHNWFSLLHLPLSGPLPSASGAHDFLSADLGEGNADIDWESFTRGWVHAAASKSLTSSSSIDSSHSSLPPHRSQIEHSQGLQ